MAIVASDISFSYKEAAIFDAFSLEIEPSIITAITGDNGTGKTTLAKLLVGLLKPQSGSVTIDDLNTKDSTIAEISNLIGFVMQNPEQQMFCTSVKDEVEFGLRNMNLSENEIVARRDEYIDYFDISKYLDRFPYELSLGEKQRVMLAAILSKKPKYLILDEPTSALDKVRKESLSQYLLRVKNELDCGVVVITHDKNFVDSYADIEVRL